MNVRIAFSAILILGLAVGSIAAAAGPDEQLAKMLKRFPQADANGDGKLTLDEARAFRRKRSDAQPRQAPDRQRFALEKLLKVYEARTFKDVPYRLMKPIDVADNPDKAYPLILSLHGAGGRGNDNKKNLRVWNGMLADPSLRRKHPCFVVVPQTSSPWTVPGSTPKLTDEQIAELPDVWQKIMKRRRDRGWDAAKGDLGKVFDLLDALAREFRIDKDRVYVLGHSMGGFGTWNAICEQPKRFAAAIPTAGGCPPWRDLNRIAKVPIWSFHGAADPTVPVELTRSVFRRLKEIGGNMKYTELKGVRHNANLTAFAYKGDDPERGFITQYASDRCDKTADVWDWLFAQRRSSAAGDDQVRRETIRQMKAIVNDTAFSAPENHDPSFSRR